jgi:hypothetical protein
MVELVLRALFHLIEGKNHGYYLTLLVGNEELGTPALDVGGVWRTAPFWSLGCAHAFAQRRIAGDFCAGCEARLKGQAGEQTYPDLVNQKRNPCR